MGENITEPYMILSDGDIVKEIKAGEIIFKPFKKEYVQPASVDLHLDRHFLVFDTQSFPGVRMRRPPIVLHEYHCIRKQPVSRFNEAS